MLRIVDVTQTAVGVRFGLFEKGAWMTTFGFSAWLVYNLLLVAALGILLIVLEWVILDGYRRLGLAWDAFVVAGLAVSVYAVAWVNPLALFP